DDIYYLQFNHFSDTKSDNSKDEFSNWKSFLVQTFSTIDSLKLHNLVIDLRNNVGGNSLMGDILISYWKLPDSLATFTCDLCISELMLKDYDMDLENIKKILAEELNREIEDFILPYVIQDMDNGIKKVSTEEYCNQQIGSLKENNMLTPLFEGKIIILTGSKTFSSAVMFATMCQDNGLATIYGTPTGGKPSCFGDILSFTLPHTAIPCGVSHKYFRRPDYTRDPSDSLYPDVWLEIKAEDYFSGKDSVWEKVREDIKNNTVPEPRRI
ncbi:MAG TPA: S41 family peptidase, partial [Candidatus Syntrophosphaera sp.]|nr:S41 family peptidase [Candidatus Syntrophosphaera sp.]